MTLDVKLYADWDFVGAEREFRRALELDSNYATAHQWYAEYLSAMGRHEEDIRKIFLLGLSLPPVLPEDAASADKR